MSAKPNIPLTTHCCLRRNPAEACLYLRKRDDSEPHPTRQHTNLQGNIVALALVLTAVLLVTGIGISTVVLEGSNRAQEMDKAVAAYYMANSGIEMQLFEIRKDNKTLAQVAGASSTYPGGNKWISTTGYEQSQVKHIDLLPEEEFTFVDLFDPDNIQSNSSAARVEISWQPNAADCGAVVPQIEAAYTKWQFSGGVIWPSDANYTIAPFSGPPMSINLDPNFAYRLRLRPFKCSVENINISIFDLSGNKLNYPGDITLGSEGTYQGTTQKLSVTMPRQDILSGIFSYIIFSEESLCKKVGLAGSCP